MKKLNKHLIALSLFAAPFAQAELSTTITGTSDYVFRGATQSNEKAAVQASLDYGHESGAFAGIWASNVEFEGDNQTDFEVDYYLGYAGEASGIEYDVSYVYYAYPGAADDFNYGEAIANAYIESFTLTYAYSNDFVNSDESAHYASVAYDYALPYEIGLTAQVGYSFGDFWDMDGGDEVVDYSLTFSKEVAGFGLSLAAIDTDQDDNKDYSDFRVVFAIEKSFDL